jgi:hypothetical protein
MANRSAILNARPTGRVGKAKGLKTGQHGPGEALYQAAAVLGLDFERIRIDFTNNSTVTEVAADGPLAYAESVAGNAIAKLTPTAARPSHAQLTIAADAGATSAITLAFPKMALAEQNPWIEAKFDMDDVTNIELSLGFVDAVPASAADILGDIDTPTFAGGIADAAVIGLDTEQTLTTAALVTIGTSTAVGKTTLPTAAPVGVPTINVQVIWRVELRNDRVFAFVNGILVAERTGPDIAKLLTPVFLIASKANDALEGRLDYIEFGQERVGAPLD